MLKYDLYTFVQSNGMNGVTHETHVVRLYPWWEKTLIGAEIGLGALTALAVVLYVLPLLKKKEQ